MDIKINNLLNLQLVDEDVNNFIDVFGTLKNAIHSQSKKVGFKKNGQITVELHEDTIDFIEALCNEAGIMSETEIKEQEKDNQ